MTSESLTMTSDLNRRLFHAVLRSRGYTRGPLIAVHTDIACLGCTYSGPLDYLSVTELGDWLMFVYRIGVPVDPGPGKATLIFIPEEMISSLNLDVFDARKYRDLLSKHLPTINNHYDTVSQTTDNEKEDDKTNRPHPGAISPLSW